MRAAVPALLVLSSALVQTVRAQVLDSFKDTNRVVLLFAPTDRDPRLVQQLDLLRHHAAGFKDRDLVFILSLVHAGPPESSDVLRSLKTSDVSAAEQQALRHRFQVGPGDFTFLLIGKDGGEKLRSRAPVAADTLNQTIDAMPMRRDEMRHKQ